MKTKKIFLLLGLYIALSSNFYGQKNVYPDIADDQFVLQGDKCSWDADAVHTLSIVEVNRDGYKYWGYYGLDHYGNDVHARKAGLVRSNDLLDWEKYEHNPIIAGNCRWPTVIFCDSIFYLFYAEYKHPDGDSRIVMAESKNGIDFENKKVVVPYADGQQNQNPFVYFNENDETFYLFYYNGTERAPKNKRWSIYVKKCKDIKDIPDQQPYEVITSNKTMAAPSVAYYNNTYFLLVEEFSDDTNENWVTNAFQSDFIDRGFIRVTNNPILYKNDACAFQYVLNNNLYVTYSHCLNLKQGKWILRMMRAK